ncbi:type III secretion system export apparatus subunit SctT [Bradyrhizobium sp. CB3481]|uniref:type III secretion system export apparatus subunit SctT n=1 Tax=Bradyrhizobium sp. CB3481 TaxID=3039158 RepID=UPI0024B0A601|nr:type III secretion system export apparatus subunit SctT [Bradyrhizobium sp. CB3481]WFU14911.1 type III secretion system export apparatus subunit SctT [Bradyrhizobium sp. CB3481]
MMLAVPILGRSMVTGMARGGVVIALAFPVMVRAWATKPADLDITRLTPILGLGLKELLVGLVLGLPVAATMWGVEASGTFIDDQRGATMASLLNEASGNQASLLGTFLGELYATWLFVTGGFSKLLEAFYRSHDVWPLWSFYPTLGSEFVRAVLSLADVVMVLTLLLAGPAVVGMFLSELGLALISRFAPQLQVFYVATSVKSMVALLLLMLSLTIILTCADTHMLPAAAFLSRIAE